MALLQLWAPDAMERFWMRPPSGRSGRSLSASIGLPEQWFQRSQPGLISPVCLNPYIHRHQSVQSLGCARSHAVKRPCTSHAHSLFGFESASRGFSTCPSVATELGPRKKQECRYAESGLGYCAVPDCSHPGHLPHTADQIEETR